MSKNKIIIFFVFCCCNNLSSSKAKRMEQESNITFEVDKAARLRVTRAYGVITDEILFDAFERLIADSDYDHTLNELLDLRGVEQLSITLSAVDRLETLFESTKLKAHNKVAIVAASTHVYGMARMYGLRSWKSELFMVSRNLEEAQKWVGIFDEHYQDS
jgi:hypothetical protein